MGDLKVTEKPDVHFKTGVTFFEHDDRIWSTVNYYEAIELFGKKDAEIAKRDERIKILEKAYPIMCYLNHAWTGPYANPMKCVKCDHPECPMASRSPEAPAKNDNQKHIKISSIEWEQNKNSEIEIVTHPCDNADPDKCVCKGACSCHWKTEAPARERAESRGSQRDGATVNPEPQRISSAPEETMECTCCRINMKKKKYKDGGEYWNCPQCDKVYDIVPK